MNMDERLERNSSDSLGTLGRSWGWVLFFGLLTLAIGIIMVLYPDVTLKVVGILFALQLFLVGLFTLVTAFTGSERSRVLSAILGALAIIAAIICLKNIAQTVIILTLILGIYWVVYGVIDVVMGIGDRSLPHRPDHLRGGGVDHRWGDRALLPRQQCPHARSSARDLVHRSRLSQRSGGLLRTGRGQAPGKRLG